MKELCAIRGAITVENDSIDEIDNAVKLMFDKIMNLNNLNETDLININFTLTPDLITRNPAAALRKANYCSNVPLFCSQEAKIEGMLEKVIRVMILCNMEKQSLKHVYMNKAKALRKEYFVE